MSATYTVTGNTYPVKDQLKALGGRWNAAAKGWDMPAEKVGEARKLIESVVAKPKTPKHARATHRRYECDECGDYVDPGTQCWETGLTH